MCTGYSSGVLSVDVVGGVVDVSQSYVKNEKSFRAEVFHFDLRVFAASLTVMRSGESVRTAGI